MKRNALKMMMINGMLAAAALHAQPSVSPEIVQNLRHLAGLRSSANLIGVENGEPVRRDLTAATLSMRSGSQPQALSNTSSIVVPLVLNGIERTTKIATTFSLVNMSRTPARVTVEFFDANGSRLAIPIANDLGNLGGVYELMYGTFQEKEYGSFLTYPSGSLKAAYARVESAPAGAIQLIVTKAFTDSRGFWGLLPAQAATRYDTDVVYPVESTDYRFSMVNTATLPLTATIRSRSNDGVELCRINKTIYAGQALLLTPALESSCIMRLGSTPHTIEISTEDPGLNIDNYALTPDSFLVAAAYSASTAQ